MYKEIKKNIAERLIIFADALARLEVRIAHIEKLCPGVIGQNDYDREMNSVNVERSKSDARSKSR